MGRRPCCSKEGLNKGAWTVMEDKVLVSYIKSHGEGKWRKLPERAGLKRCGKSCRLRWLNYLRPDIKRGNISDEEEDLIIRLHNLLGNRWSLIAGRLPGRTDNEIKNYWNTTLAKKRVLYSSHRSNIPPSKSKGKSPMTERPSTTGTPPTPIEATDAFQVIRPKATRCTRAFFTLDPRNNNVSLTSGKSTTDLIQRIEAFFDDDFLDDWEDCGSLQAFLDLEEDWQFGIL